jgi:hypothetical protein
MRNQEVVNDPKKTVICDRIRFWHKKNVKDVFEFGVLESLSLKDLRDILIFECDISSIFSGG